MKILLKFIPGQQEVSNLIRPICTEEITDVIKHFPPNKASGPDGYTAEFFKCSWEITSQSVVQAIKEFFTTGKLLTSVNSTWITLMPTPLK